MEDVILMKYKLGVAFFVLLGCNSCKEEPKYHLPWRWFDVEIGWINNLDDEVAIQYWRNGLHAQREFISVTDTFKIGSIGHTPDQYLSIKYLPPCAACPDSLIIEYRDTCFMISSMNPGEELLNWENASIDTDSVLYINGYFSIDSSTVKSTSSCD